MAASYIYHDAYFNELDVERMRFFRYNSPWTASPILSALVFIALSTLVVFYMQARSLSRKRRTTTSGATTRLPATIVWGLCSLLHSQLSHAHAEKSQLYGVINGSEIYDPELPSATCESILHAPDQFINCNLKNDQLSGSSQILSQVEEFPASREMTAANEELDTLSREHARDYASQYCQPEDFRDGHREGIRATFLSRLLNGKMLLMRGDYDPHPPSTYFSLKFTNSSFNHSRLLMGNLQALFYSYILLLHFRFLIPVKVSDRSTI